MNRMNVVAICAIVLLTVCFTFLIVGTGQAQADTIYVNGTAAGANDGSSWTDAFTDVQSALALAVATDEIWVAEGIYYPDEGTGQTDNDRFSTFQLKEDVDLYGGFPDSGSPTWAQRDWTVNLTVLSGDLEQNDITDPNGVGTTTANIVGANAYNVIRSSGTTGITEVTVLDGFVVTGGNANGGACPGDALNAAACGGGMSNDGNGGSARPTIQHVIFSANHGNMYGGGLICWTSTASPVLDDVTFVANTSQTGGGMASQWGSNPSLTNIVFDNNYADNYGGGIYLNSAGVEIISGTFTGNSGNYGGGIYAYDSVVSGTDVTFISNESRSGSFYGGGGICNRSGTLSLMNAVFDQNTANRDGGGIHNYNGTLSITSGTFTGNTTPNRGGGIASEADQAGGIARATVIDCLFDANTSNDSGGGIYFSEYMAVSSSGTVIGCTFNNNTSTYGAGIQSNETMLAISDCVFDGNTATNSSGGGLGCMAWGPPTEVRVSDSTFNGNSAPYGGGVSNGYRITLTDCIFTGNSASNGGGGFRDNQSNSAIVTGCTFIGNTASEGAAVDNYGDVAPVYTDCVFSGNTATNRGGAMNNEGWGAGCNPQVTNCMFSGNSANNYGGAIYNDDGAGLVLTNSTFGNNTTGFMGGGLYQDSSGTAIAVNNSIFWGNTPDQIFDWGGLVTANYSDIQGGGFAGTGNIDQDPQFVGGNDLHIEESSPCVNAGSNAAIPPGIVTDIDGDPRILLGTVDMGADENPGPIFVDEDAVLGANDGSSWTDAFLNLQDGLAAATPRRTIWVAAGTYTPVRPGSPGQRTDSFAMKNGVGIYGGFDATETARDQRNREVNATHLTGEIGNPGTATDNCYHVFYHSGSPVLDGSAVLDGFIISDGYADGGGNHNNGGGMFNDSGSPSITNCTFRDNHAATDGGGMFNQNGAAPTISGCLFDGNSATDGGGMYNAPTTAPVISSGTFSNNDAVGGFGSGAGGGICNRNNDAIIDGIAFISNTATWDGGGAFNERSTTPSFTGCLFQGNHAIYGGGMSIDNTDPPITGCDFLYNTADYGAGLYTDNCASVIDSSTFIANDATMEGGGIFNTYFSGSITGCVFGGPLSGDGNSAIQHGGGIYNDSSSPPITGCLFWNNSGSQGGAIYNAEYSDVVITSGTFMNNVAWDRGGGIYSDQNFGDFSGSDIVLTDCTFETNLAQWRGGAFYNDYGDPVITNCDFDSNVAVDSGGGMFNYGGDPDIAFCTFWLNSGTYGGGIYNQGNQAAVVINSGTFTNNHAYVDGGGIYNDFSGDLLAPGTISNCYFGSNTADGNGGGMFNDGDYHNVLNCTFEQNTAIDGGGVYNYGNYDYFEGCTFESNQVTNRGGGAFNDGADTTEFVGCDFDQNQAQQGGGMANYDWIDTPVTNCIFTWNTAISDGGAMYNVQDADPIVTNCTFQSNTASGSGSGIYNTGNSHPVMANCILWDEETNEVISDPTSSATITYSDVWGGYPTGAGNINLDPLFIGMMNPRLQPLSPCINSGSDAAVPAGITTDFDGNPRFIGRVDMGAFEDNSLEFGDAPDPTYPTLLASNGARHGAGALLLGALKDFEPDGQPTAASDGDDNTGLDDEDGVFFTSPLYAYPIAPGTVTVDVVASGSCNLSAWMDFNIDGDWADAGENIFADQVLNPGTNSLIFQIPAGATPGTTHARFRATTDSVITYTGLASDGEVEDYQVVILNGAGTIIVEKITDPASGTDTFTFTGTPNGTISHGQQIVEANVMPGTYTSRELFTVGWQLTDITCNDSITGNSSGDTASGSITLRVEPGESVTCVCTNTQLYPSAEAADEGGAGKDQFTPDESVWAAGSQFTPGSNVDIYITPDFTWVEGMPIAGTLMETAVVNGSGTFHIEVWPPPLVVGEYDMVFDANRNGNYDTRTDFVDDPNHPGFVVAEPLYGGPTVGGQVMPVNKAALLVNLMRFPIGMLPGIHLQ